MGAQNRKAGPTAHPQSEVILGRFSAIAVIVASAVAMQV
jgi:hypothetical protein